MIRRYSLGVLSCEEFNPCIYCYKNEVDFITLVNNKLGYMNLQISEAGKRQKSEAVLYGDLAICSIPLLRDRFIQEYYYLKGHNRKQ